MISTVTLFIFYAIIHVLLTNQMSRVYYFLDNKVTINYWNSRVMDKNLSPEESALAQAMSDMWNQRLYHFQLRAMDICYLIHVAWLPQLFQHAFSVVFSVKNKRSPHLLNLGYFLDFILVMDGLLYIFTVYKGWRYDTFLVDLTDE